MTRILFPHFLLLVPSVLLPSACGGHRPPAALTMTDLEPVARDIVPWIEQDQGSGLVSPDGTRS
ncbi:MAG: hypothetical protein LC130_14995 [Bryobacterales bacterium]|nr:hypothetical protein [Bryobacterales bacterium]MEB2363592.1 hypothetical protein [Bryobacterales bacterium]